MEKALEFLTKLKQARDFDGNLEYSLDEAIAELEEEQRLKCASIEEIEYALSKPEYAGVYLNNALRFLKEKQK